MWHQLDRHPDPVGDRVPRLKSPAIATMLAEVSVVAIALHQFNGNSSTWSRSGIRMLSVVLARGTNSHSLSWMAGLMQI